MSLPVLNLDDRSFEELVDEARKLIPIYAPRWTDHNISDPGITLVDLFAWLTEMQLYGLNLISRRHLLKYLALLDMKPRPASAAVGDLKLTATSVTTVPQNTPFKTDSNVSALTFESEEEIDVLPMELEKVISYANYRLKDVTDFNNHAQTYYHAFGEHPARGHALYLGFKYNQTPGGLTGKTLRLAIYPYESDLPPIGAGLPGEDPAKYPIYPAAETAWEIWKKNNGNKEEWQPLTIASADPNVPVLSRKGIISITLPAELNKGIPARLESLFDQASKDKYIWLRCQLDQTGHDIPPRLDRILPNVVQAIEGETAQQTWQSTGLPGQVFKTGKHPIIPGSQTVKVNGETWQPVMDFDGSAPGDPHYILQPADGEIRFSNGLNGSVPGKGKTITIHCRAGGGTKGNIKAGTPIKTTLSGITAEIPYPANGGEEAETIDNAFFRLKKNLAVPYTAVTAADYETIARAVPGLRVARARAIIPTIKQNGTTAPRPNRVTIVIIPYNFTEKPRASQPFKQAVCRYLDAHRQLTAAIEISDPDYVRVSVNAEIKIKTGYHPEQIQERISEALDHFLSPLKRTPNDNEWPFGRPVYYSEIAEIIEKIDGVDCIPRLALSASEGSYQLSEGNVEIGPLSIVYPGTHTIQVIDLYDRCKNTGEKKQTESKE